MSKVKEFFVLLWKKKGQWQVWLRLSLIPFLLPFAIIAELGRRSEDLIEFFDSNIPKAK